MFSVKAVLHGVQDPTFVSRLATEVVAPKEALWTDPERQRISLLRDDLDAKIAKEVNRIEAALSLMLSHLEGEKDAVIERLRTRTRTFPFAIGFLAGTIVTVAAFVIR